MKLIKAYIRHTRMTKCIKFGILVSQAHVLKVISLIKQNARAGYSGDGMKIVSPVENNYKVRTDKE